MHKPLAFLTALMAIALLTYWHLRDDPRVIMLRSNHGAQWIKLDAPIRPDLAPKNGTAATFCALVHIPPNFTGAILTYRAMGRVRVTWNGQVLADSGFAGTSWRAEREIPL